MEKQDNKLKRAQIIKNILSSTFNVLIFVLCIFSLSQYFSSHTSNPDLSLVELTVIIGFFFTFLAITLIIVSIAATTSQQKTIIGVLNDIMDVLIKNSKSSQTPRDTPTGMVTFVDKDGNSVTKNIESSSDMFKAIGDLLKKGSVPVKEKTFEEMNLDELNIAIKKAVDTHKYEDAARIRDLIKKKQTPNDK